MENGTTIVFGNVDEYMNNRHSLSDYVFGHRFYGDQSVKDYLLEFFNVLAGFNYKFQQGGNYLPVPSTQTRKIMDKYMYFKRIGLRRFVFYGPKEKSRTVIDEAAYQYQLSILNQKITNGSFNAPKVEYLQQILRGYGFMEANRSWFAKFLLPIHHNFLFAEAMRKGIKKMSFMGTKDEIEKVDELKKLISTNKKDPDTGLQNTRNFFARGGEMYYIFLSLGINQMIDNKEIINFEKMFYDLLVAEEKELGDIAKIIDQSWLVAKGQNVSKNQLHYSPISPSEIKKIKSLYNSNRAEFSQPIGWTIFGTCDIFRMMTEDVYRLMSLNIEPLEKLELLYVIIPFHIVLYLYHVSNSEHPVFSLFGTKQKSCNEIRGKILVDVNTRQNLDIKKASSAVFTANRLQIRKKGMEFLEKNMFDILTRLFPNKPFDTSVISLLDLLVELIGVLCGYKYDYSQETILWKQPYISTRKHFDKLPKKGIFNVSEYKIQKKNLTTVANKLYRHYDSIQGRLEIQQLETIINSTRKKLCEAIWKVYEKTYQRNALAVHNRILKGIGFVVPPTGKGARYVFEPKLFYALTLINLEPDKKILFKEMLKQFYLRYGIVIGPEEAKDAKFDTIYLLNVDLLDENVDNLKQWYLENNFLLELSDSNAYIINPLEE